MENSDPVIWELPATRVMILAGLSLFTLAFLANCDHLLVKPPPSRSTDRFCLQDPGKIIIASCLTAVIFFGWLIYFLPVERGTPLAEDLGVIGRLFYG